MLCRSLGFAIRTGVRQASTITGRVVLLFVFAFVCVFGLDTSSKLSFHNTQTVGINAREILDSRGFPTVECDVITAGGVFTAAVPSGASTVCRPFELPAFRPLIWMPYVF